MNKPNRNTNLIVVTAILQLGVTCCFIQAQPAERPAAYVEGELLVKFRGGPRGQAAQEACKMMGHRVKRHFDLIGWQHIRLPAGTRVPEGLAQYRNHPDVLAVEPNGIDQAVTPVPTNEVVFTPASTTTNPNDPMFGQQYGLGKIGATNVWATTTGNTTVVVVVIDTGINYNHEDLRDNMWRNPGEIPGNGVDDDGNGFVDDVYGIDTADDPFGNDSDPMDVDTQSVGYHGTACAGIIGAVGNNGRGITGVNWRVQIMAIRAVQQINSITQADRIQAWEYVLLMKQRGVNIRVVSMSWGGTTFSAAARDACIAVGNAGVMQVAIAGNSSTDNDTVPFNPASYPASNMLSVAASDLSDNLAGFSNYGRTNVDLAAPGVEIVTTSGASTNAYYGSPGLNGTSVAGPHVAGAAALLFAANPGVSADDVKIALLETADVLPAFTNKMVSNGRLNLGRALYHPAIVPNVPPYIASQPRSQTTNEGATVSFIVTAYGAQPLTYQWHKEHLPLADGTNAILTLANLTGSQAGDLTVVVSNAYGAVTSAVATLTVLVAPRLVGPLTPLQVAAVLGETVTLSVETTGTLPIGYRWRHLRTNGTSANVTNVVLNQHTCFLTFTVGTNSGGAYTLILTNAAQTTSVLQRTNIMLTVLSDSDGDGLPDAWETAYPTATDAGSDTDLDGMTNLQEYRAGTDPTNALSHLRVESISLLGETNAVRLKFIAAPNKTYTLQAGDRLETNTWTRMADVVAAATNRVVEIFDTAAASGTGNRYYRLATPREP